VLLEVKEELELRARREILEIQVNKVHKDLKEHLEIQVARVPQVFKDSLV